MKAVPARRRTASAELTIGMEEEFILIDPRSGQGLPLAEEILRRIDGPIADRVVPELAKFQIETNSTVHTDLRHLAHDLLRLREAVAVAATDAGLGLAACGVCLTGVGTPPLTSCPRYLAMHRHFRALLDGQGVCGCHVHIGIADREEAIQVSNHVRPWLPLLQSLTCNSPICDGRDTGYASWRAILWARWPSAGPPPFFSSAAHYDALVEALQTSGIILDRGMVYWLIRLSGHLPTLEFRTADTCATVEEATVLAGLIRALAATALADVREGVPAPQVDQTLLCAAYWRAARDGMEGDCFDPLSGRRMPAWELAGRLLRHVRRALEDSGDLALVSAGLSRLHQRGTGAARQRAAYHRRRQLSDVAQLLIGQTREAVPDFFHGHRAPLRLVPARRLPDR
ncbi:carboxylate-amine ligase [Streptosporangium sp. CA-135522]|uniref:carboxylate-amine ligase n=1 Tax=Streptosporangium sp. CA-135522 TaxID=3240072 RepID=UPI003D8AF58D